jgi:nucleotide-binding universal stress UspA family protein
MPQRHPSAPRRILAATRARDDDRAVVYYAAELARSFGAALVLVGVAALLPAPSTAPTFEPFAAEAEQEEQDLFDRLARGHLEELEAEFAPELSTQSALKWGAPGPATVEAARDHDADLVVVPMHDHADRHVLHHCQVPVLVVPTDS